MRLNSLLVLPVYYGLNFAYRMMATNRQVLKYNRKVQDVAHSNKYMVMVTFGNKNERNPKLLPSLSLTRATFDISLTQKISESGEEGEDSQEEQQDRTITLTNGYAKGQTVIYDHFSSPSPLDLSSIQVSTNSDLYIEWIIVSQLDKPGKRSHASNNNHLYPIFDSVQNKPRTVHRYSTSDEVVKMLTEQQPVVNDNYQVLVRDGGKQHPHTQKAPWYEYNAYGYLDNIRYILQYYGNKLTRSLVAPFWPYKQQIYNGMPMPYSSVADYEVMFGKTMVSVWQTSDCSLVPYVGRSNGQTKYLDKIDSSLHDSLYICDMTKFRKVKAECSPGYKNRLYWGTVIMAYFAEDDVLKPVLVDLTGLADGDGESNNEADSDNEIYTPKDADWLTGLKKFYNTHETLLFFYHITFIHEFCEYLSLVFKRNMPVHHPLYHLYSPFSNQEISGGMLNRNAIGFIFPAFTRDTYEQIINTLYDGLTYRDMMFDKYLEDYGFTDHHLTQLSQIERMRRLWCIANNYVNKYVDTVYAKSDISQDVYLKQWFQELNSGSYKGFAGQLTEVTVEKVKQVFTIHIFQALVHWSDHNITHSYLTSEDADLGYDPSNQGRASASDKMMSNYILLIANTSKLLTDKDNYPQLMNISRILVLENPTLMKHFYDLLHELLDFEHYELGVNNYREALLLNDMYQGATY